MGEWNYVACQRRAHVGQVLRCALTLRPSGSAGLRYGQANKTGDAVGRGRQESSFLEHPGARSFREKRKALTGKKKNQEPEPKKGDILIEVRKGTF
jgi:hypothetical protein